MTDSSEISNNFILTNKINLYYNESLNKLSPFIDDKKHYELVFTNDKNDSNEFIVDIFYNKKHIIKGHYEILGLYNITCSVWYWSFLSHIEKNLTKMTKKIKKFHKKLLNNNNNNNNENDMNSKETELYMFYSSNFPFFVLYKNLIDLIKFGLYVTEGKWILSHKLNENIIEFIILTDIIQYS